MKILNKSITMRTANDMYSTSYLLPPMVFFGTSLPSKMLLVSRNLYQVSLVYLIFVPEDMNPIFSWPFSITSHLPRREHQGIYLTTLLNIQIPHTFVKNIQKQHPCRKTIKTYHDIILDSVCLSPDLIFFHPLKHTPKKKQRIRSLATASSLSTCGASPGGVGVKIHKASQGAFFSWWKKLGVFTTLRSTKRLDTVLFFVGSANLVSIKSLFGSALPVRAWIVKFH